MERFFFHVHDHWGSARDEEGVELHGLDAAFGHAVAAARDLIAEDVRNGWLDLCGRIDICDAGGVLLYSLPFRGAVEAPPCRR